MQPLRKKILQPLTQKISCNLMLQPLGTKKKSCNLSAQENHTTSQHKKKLGNLFAQKMGKSAQSGQSGQSEQSRQSGQSG